MDTMKTENRILGSLPNFNRKKTNNRKHFYSQRNTILVQLQFIAISNSLCHNASKLQSLTKFSFAQLEIRYNLQINSYFVTKQNILLNQRKVQKRDSRIK